MNAQAAVEFIFEIESWKSYEIPCNTISLYLHQLKWFFNSYIKSDYVKSELNLDQFRMKSA